MLVEKVDHFEERVELRLSRQEYDASYAILTDSLGSPGIMATSVLKKAKFNFEMHKIKSKGYPNNIVVQMSLPVYNRFSELVTAHAERLKAKAQTFSDLGAFLVKIEPTPMETLEVSK